MNSSADSANNISVNPALALQEEASGSSAAPTAFFHTQQEGMLTAALNEAWRARAKPRLSAYIFTL